MVTAVGVADDVEIVARVLLNKAAIAGWARDVLLWDDFVIEHKVIRTGGWSPKTT